MAHGTVDVLHHPGPGGHVLKQAAQALPGVLPRTPLGQQHIHVPLEHRLQQGVDVAVVVVKGVAADAALGRNGLHRDLIHGRLLQQADERVHDGGFGELGHAASSLSGICS